MPEINDHEVVRQIGSGSYGTVWLAKSLTGAWRAVKVLYRDDFDDERTFIREFEGIQYYEPIARNHPGLVHILHVGRKDGDTPFYYYVMELADDAQAGIHIDPAEYIPRSLDSDRRNSGNKPMPLDYCLEIGSQLSHALLYLHSKNLTHRDIKPSNVIFVNGRPKLADIGLVAHHGRRSFVGTEGFIPPEGPGTERADVYALSKVLYEITTGKDRLDFPELPDDLPEGIIKKKWLALNEIICAAGEPREEEATIVSAETLAEAIDSIKGFSVHTRFKFPKRKRKLKTSTKLTIATLSGAFFAILLMFIFVPFQKEAIQNPHHDDLLEQKPTDTETINAYIIITSNERASIYDQNGRYIDETPYGPTPIPGNTPLKFTLKKHGYADWSEIVQVDAGETLVVQGQLKPYNPPIEGQIWIDTLGNKYLPIGNIHTSENILQIESFKQFIASDKKLKPNFDSVQTSSDTNAPFVVMTTPEAIKQYTNWLRKQCEKEGILGEEFTIKPEPVAGIHSNDGTLQAYRITIEKIHQVPISLFTQPSGASVFLNGKLIGSSPLDEYLVNQEPYTLEVKLPGYATIRRSGQDPEGLYLPLQLEKDYSVVFQNNWINSLKMRFAPLDSSTLVQTCEVTVDEFNEYIKATGSQTPPQPDFPQEGNHPIVNITKEEAQQFAKWLTEKEKNASLIEQADEYRLPTDKEWSRMAGIENEQGTTPYDCAKSSLSKAPAYYWGYTWPPKNQAGNFADKSALQYLPSSKIIPEYIDAYPYTSPIAIYKANSQGLFDIEGNVQEWVNDTYGGPDNFKLKKYNVARGGNYLSFRPAHLNPAVRIPMPPESRDLAIGFRLVLHRKESNIVIQKSGAKE